MRLERWRLLGGNLLTSLSMPLALSPYKLAVPFSFWSVFILTSNVTMLQCGNTACD